MSDDASPMMGLSFKPYIDIEKYGNEKWLEENGDGWVSYTHPNGEWCHCFYLEKDGTPRSRVNFNPKQKINLVVEDS